jgi:hypothetical protein
VRILDAAEPMSAVVVPPVEAAATQADGSVAGSGCSQL